MESFGLLTHGISHRTEKLMIIKTPIPLLAAQRTFDHLQTEVAALKTKHTAIREANAALLPATLERVFAGGD